MAFFFIDEQDDYKLKVDKSSILFVPEFRALVEHKNYGWNFMYYAFLFISRSPFGRKPEEIRDQLVFDIVNSFPLHTTSPKNVKGFYKDKKFFPSVKTKLKELFPDTLYDSYLSSMNLYAKIGYLRDELELDPKKIKDGESAEENFAYVEAYTKQMDILLKQIRGLEKDVEMSLSNKNVTMGMGAILRSMEQ